jgi:2,4-dienoyl-CoA reductase-like NADH-dependent reductase (Old Yellow Enzyme family)
MMLAPLTNLQSNPDGTLSEDEYRWLLLRAQGGFGLTMTCAASVQLSGKAFGGQLGIYSDQHIPGLARLAKAINAAGSLSAVQLHHGGWRAKHELTGEVPHAPWEDAETGARAISTAEVEQLVEDFILAGLRAEKAGFNGVELHGAHGYLLCQFLNAERNHRSDQYGGSFESRARVLFEIVAGLRARAAAGFQIGIRLSPENHGIPLAEARALAQQLMTSRNIDYLDMSLWDVFKEPIDKAYAGKPLIAYFTDLERGSTRLGVAGKIMTAGSVRKCLEHGADFALIGRAAILHQDFPRLVAENSQFESVPRPVTRAYLRDQGLGPAFIEYMGNWKGFVAPEEPA